MSTDRAIYIDSSNAGIFPVMLYVVPTKGGVEFNIESSDSFRPKVKIPSDFISEVGAQLRCSGLHKQIVTWKSGRFTRVRLTVKPTKEQGVVSCIFFGSWFFLLGLVSFKIETDKIQKLGKVLCEYDQNPT